MRIAIIADIHGNYRALEAVLADLADRRIDTVVSLGDNVGYGPEPEEVVRRLCSDNIFSVMGNHEFALISPSYYTRLNPTSRESLDLTRRLLSAASLDWLAGLHPFAVKYGARFVHGCPPASISCYLFRPSLTRLARVFQGYEEALAFSGHTHALALFSCDRSGRAATHPLPAGITPLDSAERYLVIPGSVGQPRDSLNNKAKYAIWDTSLSHLEIRAISYEVETTVRLLHERGFPPHNAQRLLW